MVATPNTFPETYLRRGGPPPGPAIFSDEAEEKNKTEGDEA